MFRRDIDVAVAAEKASKVPILVLTLVSAAPEFGAKLLWQIIFQPLRAFSDAFDKVRRNAGFLFQFAKAGHPWIIFALVNPALRHLPRFVGVIDTRSDEHSALRIEQHHADTAAVIIGVGHDYAIGSRDAARQSIKV